jgi:hypothetical protein
MMALIEAHFSLHKGDTVESYPLHERGSRQP